MSIALVIDDNRATADALVQMLEVLGLTARTAYGSSAAMGVLAAMTPELILLDINMPGVDGFEVLGYLQREPRLIDVPVIVISSEDQRENLDRAKKGGARAWVTKPATLDSLEAALKKAGILEEY